MVKGQFEIQQMSFMVIFLFIFFVVAGLFFVGIQMANMKQGYSNLQQDQAVVSLQSISNMPEFNYDSQKEFTIDKDKLEVMTSYSQMFSDLFAVASIRVYMAPFTAERIKCPAPYCNFYEVYSSSQTDVKELYTYVSVCQRVRENFQTNDNCELAKLAVGVKIKK